MLITPTPHRVWVLFAPMRDLILILLTILKLLRIAGKY